MKCLLLFSRPANEETWAVKLASFSTNARENNGHCLQLQSDLSREAISFYALVKVSQSVVCCLRFPRTAQLGAVKFQIPLPGLSPFLTWLLLALHYFFPISTCYWKQIWLMNLMTTFLNLISFFFAPKTSEIQREYKKLLTDAHVCDVFAKDIWPNVTSKPLTCQNGIFFWKLADLTWIPCNC